MAPHPWRQLRELPHVRLAWEARPGILGSTDGATTIAMHPHQSQAQRRCTLQHELVHLARGTRHGCDEAEERAVERAAARILIPMPLLLDKLRWTRHLAELADECWVDEPMLMARLDGLSPAERAMVAELAEGVEAGGDPSGLEPDQR